MELNNRDQLTRDRINKLTKQVTADAYELFNELARLECVSIKEIQDSIALLTDTLAVASDVLACCKMPYADYLKTPRWKMVREKRIMLDGGQCTACGDIEFLSVHHMTYANRGL